MNQQILSLLPISGKGIQISRLRSSQYEWTPNYVVDKTEDKQDISGLNYVTH